MIEVTLLTATLASATLAGWLAGRARQLTAPSPAQVAACKKLLANPRADLHPATRKAIVRRGLAKNEGGWYPGCLSLTPAGRQLARRGR